MVLEKALKSPLDCKEIQPVHPKGDQSWVFIGRTVEAETPILWPPGEKSWLIGKVPDAGKDWGQEEKGMTEDEMVGWHHWLDGHGFGWILGVGDGQGGLACCDSWGRKVRHDWVSELNWTEYYKNCKNIKGIAKVQHVLACMPSSRNFGLFPLSLIHCYKASNPSLPLATVLPSLSSVALASATHEARTERIQPNMGHSHHQKLSLIIHSFICSSFWQIWWYFYP